MNCSWHLQEPCKVQKANREKRVKKSPKEEDGSSAPCSHCMPSTPLQKAPERVSMRSRKRNRDMSGKWGKSCLSYLPTQPAIIGHGHKILHAKVSCIFFISKARAPHTSTDRHKAQRLHLTSPHFSHAVECFLPPPLLNEYDAKSSIFFIIIYFVLSFSFACQPVSCQLSLPSLNSNCKFLF